MKLGIIGAIVLALGLWALSSWWWFLVDIIQVLLALALLVGAGLTVAVAARKLYLEKQTEE